MRRARALALCLALGCGGALEGERATAPPADWTAELAAPDLALVTGEGRRFALVAHHFFAHAGQPHLHAYTIFERSDGALDELLRDGRLELRANGRIHALRAVPLASAAEIDPVLPSLTRSMAMQAEGLRWDPQTARYPGTQVKQWLFRLEPATAR